MYTNINTNDALEALEVYLTANTVLFPNFPMTPLIEALKFLMTHNVFQFGDTFWHQERGTAMGAPPAPTYANMSFATHEASFMSKYKESILYYE